MNTAVMFNALLKTVSSTLSNVMQNDVLFSSFLFVSGFDKSLDVLCTISLLIEWHFNLLLLFLDLSAQLGFHVVDSVLYILLTAVITSCFIYSLKDPFLCYLEALLDPHTYL